MLGIGVEGVGTFDEFSFGIYYYVEGLGVCAELVTLKQTPFVADGTYLDLVAVFGYPPALGQRSLVIHEQ